MSHPPTMLSAPRVLPCGAPLGSPECLATTPANRCAFLRVPRQPYSLLNASSDSV